MADKSKTIYLDANPAEYGEQMVALVAAQRETYNADKAAKKVIVDYLNGTMDFGEGKCAVGVTYTRWGQFQILVGDKPEAKAAKASARPTLAQYLAAQGASGQRT